MGVKPLRTFYTAVWETVGLLRFFGKIQCSGNKLIVPLLQPPHPLTRREWELQSSACASSNPCSLVLTPTAHVIVTIIWLDIIWINYIYPWSQFIISTPGMLGYPSFPRLTLYGSVIHILGSSLLLPDSWSPCTLLSSVLFCHTAYIF